VRVRNEPNIGATWCSSPCRSFPSLFLYLPGCGALPAALAWLRGAAPVKLQLLASAVSPLLAAGCP
jgi:hypothetical protein